MVSQLGKTAELQISFRGRSLRDMLFWDGQQLPPAVPCFRLHVAARFTPVVTPFFTRAWCLMSSFS